MAKLNSSINGNIEQGIKIDFFDGIQKVFNILDWLGIKEGFIYFCDRHNYTFNIDEPCVINLDILGKSLRNYIITQRESNNEYTKNGRLLDVILYLHSNQIKNGRNIIIRLYELYHKKNRKIVTSVQDDVNMRIVDLI